MVRKTDINGKLVQFAWWALATIVFTLVVAIRNRVLGIRSNATRASTLMPASSYCKASRLTRFWRGNQQTHADSLRLLRAIYFFGDVPKSVET